MKKGYTIKTIYAVIKSLYIYFDFKYPGLLYPPLQFSSHCTPEIDNSDVVVGSAENPKGLS